MVLFNLSKSDYEVNHGDRIAQLIVERISTPPLVEVEVRNCVTAYLISYVCLSGERRRRRKDFFSVMVGFICLEVGDSFF